MKLIGEKQRNAYWILHFFRIESAISNCCNLGNFKCKMKKRNLQKLSDISVSFSNFHKCVGISDRYMFHPVAASTVKWP